MIRKRKVFVKPMKPFELQRIKEENELVRQYGLKNKREVWKTLAKVNYYRSRAKALAKSSTEEQEILFKKLSALGLKVGSISDVLGLKIENVLDRRLSTVVAKRGLANTARQARQMIVHKNILVDGKVINAPSYLVPVAMESKLSVKTKAKKKVKVETPVEKVEEVSAEENTEARE